MAGEDDAPLPGSSGALAVPSSGVLPRPASDSPDLENWLTANSMLVGWIRSSIEPKVCSTISYISDAYLLWTELKERFSVGNKVRVHRLKLNSLRAGKRGKPFLMFAKEKEEERIHQFVMGLDDARFGGLCTGIIAADPLPSIGEICAKVVREEQRLSSARLREQRHEALGFFTRREEAPSSVRRDQNQSPDSRLELSSSSIRNRSALCSHCGRTGHEKKDCWQIVGFPEWWRLSFNAFHEHQFQHV
ncbi:unnamed protein product [Microthlaspi erraticum]|uniref:CCHC-type domain-containing protein n=1 Tax=Microthlaspi erraticum TaxID=1685480 RepID=A0A6D2LIV3_9BRAS|nr:unnamed protein product [Microthlaspi erraticum]